jgi:predicted glycosyltransferase involved in capsule biosynthesis
MKISFLISLKIDSDDRLSNLDISVKNLSHHYPISEIIISEIDNISKIKNRYGDINNCKHIFTKTEDFFNKQRAYNIAARESKNQIIALYDADIVMDEKIVKQAYDLIDNHSADIIWPYNGFFYDVPKKFHKSIDENKSIDCINIAECELFSRVSVGGVVFFKKEVFLNGGGGNENFKGAGWEDNEIYVRFKKLGYRRSRLGVPIFHLNHERKETSYNYNPHGRHNEIEFARIDRMEKSEILEEIKKWKWTQ